MPADAVTQLIRQAPLSFLGTVEQLGAATMEGVPVDDRTAVVRVEQVLHAPDAFRRLAGQRITVQLSPDAAPLPVGGTAAIFARGTAYGASVAVAETGRLPADAVQGHVASAVANAEAAPFAELQRQIRAEDLRVHAEGADAVVLGTVVGLDRVDQVQVSEHAPEWWRAQLEVRQVEQGDVPPGRLAVLYPNSHDVKWHNVPKPRPGQGGLWLLHATTGGLREQAAFQILHPDDYQPTQQLDALRPGGGEPQ